jgi:hypothetical protein
MPAQDGGGSVDRLLDELVALERSALDRWIRLDPQGYLDLQAPEVTYFDPFTEKRVDGLDAMQLRLAPMKKMKPPFTHAQYDMIDPKVQRHGDVALLTFNLVNYGNCRMLRNVSWLAGIPARSIVGLTGRGRSSIAVGRTHSRN